MLAWRVLFNSPDLYDYYVNRELFYDVTIWCTLIYFVFAWWDLQRARRCNATTSRPLRPYRRNDAGGKKNPQCQPRSPPRVGWPRTRRPRARLSVSGGGAGSEKQKKKKKKKKKGGGGGKKKKKKKKKKKGGGGHLTLKPSWATLDELPTASAGRPMPGTDLTPGILHFGVGNFHRAHLQVYLDRLMNAGRDHDWAIVGAGVTPYDVKMRDALQGQDWLSTVVEQSAEKSAGPRHRRDDRLPAADGRRGHPASSSPIPPPASSR